jgi:hypothetical protein
VDRNKIEKEKKKERKREKASRGMGWVMNYLGLRISIRDRRERYCIEPFGGRKNVI